jgi:hypothetical protein
VRSTAPTPDLPAPAPITSAPRQAAPAISAAPNENPPPPEPAVRFPELLTALTALERPNVGTGIGDRTQVLALKREDLNPAAVTRLSLTFPTIDKSGSTVGDSQFANEDSGTLIATPGKDKVALAWKNAGETGPGTEALNVALDRAQSALIIRWHSSMLLKNAPLMGYYYWMLQNSEIELERGAAGSAAAAQRIRLKPFDAGPQNFQESQMKVRWPVALPRGATVAAPAKDQLPAGWYANWYTDWEEKDAALRTPANASQVIKFKSPSVSGGADALFLMTFRPGLGTMESTFARQRAADQAELEKSQGVLDGIDSRIAQAKPTAEAMKQAIDPALLASRDQAARQVANCEATVKAYDALKQFDVGIELNGESGRIRIATLHFERPDAPAGK